jgi:hypothetical protein
LISPQAASAKKFDIAIVSNFVYFLVLPLAIPTQTKGANS